MLEIAIVNDELDAEGYARGHSVDVAFIVARSTKAFQKQLSFRENILQFYRWRFGVVKGSKGLEEI